MKWWLLSRIKYNIAQVSQVAPGKKKVITHPWTKDWRFIVFQSFIQFLVWKQTKQMFGGIHSVWYDSNNLFLPCMNYWLHRDKNGDDCKSIFNQGYSLSLLMREKNMSSLLLLWNQPLHLSSDLSHLQKMTKGKTYLVSSFLNYTWVWSLRTPISFVSPKDCYHLLSFPISSWEVLSLTGEKKMLQKFNSFDKDLTSQM